MLQQARSVAIRQLADETANDLQARVKSLELRATAGEQRTTALEQRVTAGEEQVAEHAELLQEHGGRLERQEERIAAAEALARESRQHAERRLALAAAAVTAMFLVLKAIGFF